MPLAPGCFVLCLEDSILLAEGLGWTWARFPLVWLHAWRPRLFRTRRAAQRARRRYGRGMWEAIRVIDCRA